MVALPALPLSQQVFAWVLRALGYADGATTRVKVSPGTLKNAQKGAPIPRSWDDLVAGGLGVLGAAPDERLRAEFRVLLRRWDDKVGALPLATELSLAEHANVLLKRAIPEIGIRLGAIAALVATHTGTPIDEWLWLVEPFDARFFGRVVRALFRQQNLLTKKAQKDALEKNAGVDWRTVERWYSGRIDVPNSAHLESLGGVLRDGAEAMLRAARLTCVLRGSLREWIGNDSTSEWGGTVADVGRVAARTLADPAGVAMLLRWLLADLDGLPGDDIPAGLQSMLPNDARGWQRRELCERLASAACEFEGGSTVDRPFARWVTGLTLVFPHPLFSAHVCGGMLGLLPAMDLFHLIKNEWMLRFLMKNIAAGGTLPFTYADGSRVERSISDFAQETARRWEATSLRFRQADDESPNDVDIIRMLFEVFGNDALSDFKQLANSTQDPLLRFTEMFMPAAAMVAPDELVAGSRALCLSRARAFAEHGDCTSALDWVKRARCLSGPTTTSETDDLLATLAAIAHEGLDGNRPARDFLCAFPDDPDSAQLHAVLLDNVRLVEGIVTTIMQTGAAPDASSALLTTLVEAIPVAIRIAYLREELSSEDEGMGPQAVDALVTRLRACLDQHPTHGRGWAVVMLWAARCGQVQVVSEAEKLATHYGAADFLEREMVRIEKDLGLTEDAG